MARNVGNITTPKFPPSRRKPSDVSTRDKAAARKEDLAEGWPTDASPAHPTPSVRKDVPPTWSPIIPGRKKKEE